MITGLANHAILIRKDGTEIPVDHSGSPIVDGDGKTAGVVLVFRNMTDHSAPYFGGTQDVSIANERKGRDSLFRPEALKL